MRVLIVADNQDITREGIKALARRTGRFDEVWESRTQRELADCLVQAPSAAVVLDYALMDTTAEYLLLLQARFPQARFLLFSNELSGDFVRRMVFSGKSFSVVWKDCALEEIETALDSLAARGQYICARVADGLEVPAKKAGAGDSPLTATEKEVLQAMAMGKTTKQIAAERFLSVYTVMTHRKNIFRKLGVNNVQEASRYALRAGIVKAGDYFI